MVPEGITCRTIVVHESLLKLVHQFISSTSHAAFIKLYSASLKIERVTWIVFFNHNSKSNRIFTYCKYKIHAGWPINLNSEIQFNYFPNYEEN